MHIPSSPHWVNQCCDNNSAWPKKFVLSLDFFFLPGFRSHKVTPSHHTNLHWANRPNAGKKDKWTLKAKSLSKLTDSDDKVPTTENHKIKFSVVFHHSHFYSVLPIFSYFHSGILVWATNFPNGSHESTMLRLYRSFEVEMGPKPGKRAKKHSTSNVEKTPLTSAKGEIWEINIQHGYTMELFRNRIRSCNKKFFSVSEKMKTLWWKIYNITQRYPYPDVSNLYFCLSFAALKSSRRKVYFLCFRIKLWKWRRTFRPLLLFLLIGMSYWKPDTFVLLLVFTFVQNTIRCNFDDIIFQCLHKNIFWGERQ